MSKVRWRLHHLELGSLCRSCLKRTQQGSCTNSLSAHTQLCPCSTYNWSRCALTFHRIRRLLRCQIGNGNCSSCTRLEKSNAVHTQSAHPNLGLDNCKSMPRLRWWLSERCLYHRLQLRC